MDLFEQWVVKSRKATGGKDSACDFGWGVEVFTASADGDGDAIAGPAIGGAGDAGNEKWNCEWSALVLFISASAAPSS